MDKLQTLITGVTLNTPTFHDITFHPSLINFFYGKNGSGKSTIARIMGTDSSTAWQPGINPGNYQLLVYNEEYIENNIQNYGNIPGVFTITKVNAEKKREITEKKKEQDNIQKLILKVSESQAAEQQASEKSAEQYLSLMWKKTEDIRKKYPETQIGYTRDRKKFLAKLEGTKPGQMSAEELEDLYKKAYSSTDVRYTPFKFVEEKLPTSELLLQPVYSSASTPYAEFLKALNNTAWVQEGHKRYHAAANGRCPYCGEKLRSSFEDDLASCFDDRYKQAVARLQRFEQEYKDTLNRIYKIIKANLDQQFLCEHSDSYRAKFDLFMEIAKQNTAKITEKIKDPAAIVELEDLEQVLYEIYNLTGYINKKIDEHNWAIDNQKAMQEEAKKTVWAYMASICQGDIAVHKKEVADAEKRAADLTRQGKDYLEQSGLLEKKISELNTQTVNTDKAMESINALLKASGFQGFELRKKPRADYVYELVRQKDDGTYEVVKGKAMSEGERHFIAFLYFYHEVMGSQSENGEANNKIVVIDDPVSSMDSSALFVIAALTRNMIELCYNNYRLSVVPQDDYIRQFFCLTHNPYFFREITYNHLKDYECVDFFEIKKDVGNNSNIVPCIKEVKGSIGNGKINYSPVKNTYDSLWDEYNTCPDPVVLMNVVRQILEYYFMQTLGFKSSELREIVTAEIRDREEQAVAAAMINLITSGISGFADNLYFDASAVDPNVIRIVMQKIFEITKQDQHYNMMAR